MNTFNTLMEAIDEVSEKLTSAEYKKLADICKELHDKNNIRPKVKVQFTYVMDDIDAHHALHFAEMRSSGSRVRIREPSQAQPQASSQAQSQAQSQAPLRPLPEVPPPVPRRTREPSSYNIYMKNRLASMKNEETYRNMPAKERFKAAANEWKNMTPEMRATYTTR
jgi:HMG-box domain